MPRNGSGSYSLPAGNPFVPNTVISSTTMNNTMNDLGTALTQSIANDGQTTPVANLPMATFRHTNVGNAVARNDYAAAGQVQDSSLQWLTSVSGTNTITASVTPSPTAYTAGQTFRFVSAGANTGAATLNINGLGAKAITKRGAVALIAGDIPSGAVAEVVYDGTQFQLLAVPGGQLLNVQTFTATGTYTPTTGTQSVIVEVVGGGGAGGGAPATGAGAGSIGGGGGASGYSMRRIASGFSGVTVTVGAAGTPNSGAGGGNGGTSSFGALVSVTGGSGGSVAGPSGGNFLAVGGAGGAGSSGDINTSGHAGAAGLGLFGSAGLILGGFGGSSFYGGGGNGSAGGIGGGGAAYGAGGGGSSNGASQAASVGGAGAPGLVIVYEYS